MAREDTIRESMRAVGVYNEIFEPAIKSLAKAERQLSRAEKEWRAQGGKMVAELVNKTGAAYTAKDPYWTAVEQLRKDVQSMCIRPGDGYRTRRGLHVGSGCLC